MYQFPFRYTLIEGQLVQSPGGGLVDHDAAMRAIEDLEARLTKSQANEAAANEHIAELQAEIKTLGNDVERPHE